jgi:hypothetical protein
MRKIFWGVILFVTWLLPFIFGWGSLADFLSGRKEEVTVSFPARNFSDFIFWTSYLLFVACSALLAYFSINRVSISRLLRGLRSDGKAWWGVELSLWGLAQKCKAKAVVAVPKSHEADLLCPLRDENQWEQEHLREEVLVPFHLEPHDPKFVPVFDIVGDESGGRLRVLHQNPLQQRLLDPGDYRVTIIISHGSLWPSRRRFHVHFDGKTIQAK